MRPVEPTDRSTPLNATSVGSAMVEIDAAARGIQVAKSEQGRAGRHGREVAFQQLTLRLRGPREAVPDAPYGVPFLELARAQPWRDLLEREGEGRRHAQPDIEESARLLQAALRLANPLGAAEQLRIVTQGQHHRVIERHRRGGQCRDLMRPRNEHFGRRDLRDLRGRRHGGEQRQR